MPSKLDVTKYNPLKLWPVVCLAEAYRGTDDREVRDSVVRLLRGRLDRADPIEKIFIRRFLEEVGE
jgi:hypothetical protein